MYYYIIVICEGASFSASGWNAGSGSASFLPGAEPDQAKVALWQQRLRYKREP